MGAIFHLLSMLGPLTAAKFWFSVVMAGVHFVRLYFGIDIGLDEVTAQTIINGVWAVGVWLIGNKRPSVPTYTDAEILAKNNRETGLNQTSIERR